jgi:chaperonin GroES
MKFRPLNDRVVVEPFEVDGMTPGGIQLPDDAKEKPSRGKVLAVGTGYMQAGVQIPLAVKVGDTVLFRPFSSELLTIEDHKVFIMQESQLFGIL